MTHNRRRSMGADRFLENRFEMTMRYRDPHWVELGGTREAPVRRQLTPVHRRGTYSYLQRTVATGQDSRSSIDARLRGDP